MLEEDQQQEDGRANSVDSERRSYVCMSCTKRRHPVIAPGTSLLVLRGLPTLKESSVRPFDQDCAPLAPERKDPSYETMLKLPPFFIRVLVFLVLSVALSLSERVRLSPSFPVFSPQSLFCSSRAAVPVISSLARVEDSTSPPAPALLL
jgi:hypothetical protein